MKMPNPAGVWRALDDDASGFISLNEIDQDSADMLLSFKRWAELSFGTLEHMFHVFDKSKSGAFSFPVFKRALRNFGFAGDASVLFKSLKPCDSGKSSKRSMLRNNLTLQDLLYLSTWESDPGKDAINEVNEEEGSKLEDDASIPPEPPSPSSAKRASMLVQTASRRAATERTERRVEAGRSQNRQRKQPVNQGGAGDPPAPRKQPSVIPSPALHHCRSADEYQAFVQASNRRKLLDTYGRPGNENLLDNVDQGPARQRLPRIDVSPNAGRMMPCAQADARSASQMQALPKLQRKRGRLREQGTRAADEAIARWGRDAAKPFHLMLDGEMTDLAPRLPRIESSPFF